MRSSTGISFIPVVLVVKLALFMPFFGTSASAQGLNLREETVTEMATRGIDLSAPLFLPASIYRSGGQEAGFIAVADVNGDGYPDLLVANTYFSNTIAVLLGKGDGTFWQAVKYGSGGGYPTSIVPVDIDGDGKLDLVVLNQGQCYACTGDGVVAILLGLGKGKFRLAATYDSGGQGSLGPAPSGMAVADVNGDGKLDVVVMNCAPSGSSGCGDGDGIVGVLLGNGGGTFQPVVTYDTKIAPGGSTLAVADINGDGRPDILVTNGCVSFTNCSNQGIGILLGKGDGTFEASVTVATAGWSSGQIAVTDLNGDGNPDVVVGGCGSIICWDADGVVSVLLGKGDGTFQPPVGYDTGASLAEGVAVADVDGDGKLDIVVVNTLGRSVGVLLGKGGGSFWPPLVFPSGTNTFAYSTAVSDLDGDGKLDVLVSNCGVNSRCGGSVGGSVGVLLSYGAVTTTLASSASPSQVGQPVTFTAKVTADSRSVPDGDVLVFYDKIRGKLSTVALSGGVGTYTTSSLPAGSHIIEALYLGNPALKRSSAVVKQIVEKAPQ